MYAANWNYGRAGEGRAQRRSKVDLELPQVERVGSEVHKEVRRASGRRSNAIEIRGQQPAEARAELEAYLRCRRVKWNSEHLGTIERTDFASGKGLCIVEDVVADVIPVRPYTHFGVVVELGIAIAKGITVVGTCCIRRL